MLNVLGERGAAGRRANDKLVLKLDLVVVFYVLSQFYALAAVVELERKGRAARRDRSRHNRRVARLALAAKRVD